MNILKSNRLNYRFANIEDKRVIFDMLTSKETSEFMFNSEFPPPSWEEFNREDSSYFSGKSSRTGNYLLIEIDNETIGTICYSCEYVKIPYCELDIWFKSKKCIGKGYGPEALNHLMQFVNRSFRVKSFIIRPWKKNSGAIRAYKKCGFVDSPNLKLSDYYSDDTLREYGDGDYGRDETFNMLFQIKE